MIVIQSQLLATKFYVPTSPGTLIWRPRLAELLEESLKYPLTLVSAPAGFGKTMLLSAWTHSLPPASSPLVAWVSLDEEDNDPQLFWIYLLSALDQQQPERFTPLLKSLQSPVAPPLTTILATLINNVLESTQRFVLILDDYHVITEQQIHSTLWYLIDRLPSQFHIILATRTDPPLPLSRLRSRRQLLEVRTEQLRCTAEETKALLHEAMGIQLPDNTVQEVAARTEGWLVGLQLLALSLQGRADPTALIEEASGNQRYILDYLTEEVLHQQPQDIQTFLLSTCIVERFSASLCDTLTEQGSGQHMLEQLERANLFLTSLDNKREWYRYHALFAEALHYRLQQTHPDWVPLLHSRASLWYAQHGQTTEAILHAFHAKEWQWAADLIEHKSFLLMSMTWGASHHQLGLLQQWLKQLPLEVMASRPRLCLASAYLLCMVAPYDLLNAWFNMAEAKLTASLEIQAPEQTSQSAQYQQERQEQQDLLRDVFIWRATLLGLWEDHGPEALSLCQKTLALLSPENALERATMMLAQLVAFYVSSANNAVAAAECGLQGVALAQTAGLSTLAMVLMGATAHCLIGAGKLHETLQLTKQASQLEKEPEDLPSPMTGWPTTFQAEVLREWNQLDAARTLIEEALALRQRLESIMLLPNSVCGYGILLRIYLSYGDLEAARSVSKELEHITTRMNQPMALHFSSYFTIVDRVRLWLASGDLDRATRWVNELDLRVRGQRGTPFACEREDVACARIFLATKQPDLALQRLEPALQRATAGQRWGHVLEIRLLQALAHQKLNEEPQALAAISEALRLGEPEGYIRIFVDEGAPVADLVSRLREQQCQTGPTLYLDTLLAAFAQGSKRYRGSSKVKKSKR
jgi:LuxR family maltose regulon positive regulatory protein